MLRRVFRLKPTINAIIQEIKSNQSRKNAKTSLQTMLLRRFPDEQTITRSEQSQDDFGRVITAAIESGNIHFFQIAIENKLISNAVFSRICLEAAKEKPTFFFDQLYPLAQQQKINLLRQDQLTEALLLANIKAGNLTLFQMAVEQELINESMILRACSSAINTKNEEALTYLCRLAKQRVNLLVQARLTTNILIALHSGSMSEQQADRLLQIVLANLPEPKNNEKDPLDYIKMGVNLYKAFPEYRSIFNHDLRAFTESVVFKLTQEALTPAKAKEAIKILNRFYPTAMITLIMGLNDINLAVERISSLLPHCEQFDHIASTKSPAIPDKSEKNQTRLYFQVIGAAMMQNKERLAHALKLCDSDTIAKLDVFFNNYTATHIKYVKVENLYDEVKEEMQIKSPILREDRESSAEKDLQIATESPQLAHRTTPLVSALWKQERNETRMRRRAQGQGIVFKDSPEQEELSQSNRKPSYQGH